METNAALRRKDGSETFGFKLCIFVSSCLAPETAEI